jgi:hypothetical protein
MFVGCLAILSLLPSRLVVRLAIAEPHDDAENADDNGVFFEKSIRPLILQRCAKCHGPKKQEANLRLDTAIGWQRGGASGPIVNGKSLAESLVLRRLSATDDERMPPDDPLQRSQYKALRSWILAGAVWPDNSPPLPRGAVAGSHWADQPIVYPTLPALEMSPGISARFNGAIDLFILRKLATEGLSMAASTDRPTLARRLYVDLLGIQPNYDDLRAFVDDPRDDASAYAAIVDRLLSAPEFGERWARHWLDVARYADTKDYQDAGEPSFPLAWTYRDFVIRAINHDLPFDEFVRLQLAADHQSIDESDQWKWAAMGFLLAGRRFNHDRHDLLDDRIDVTTRGLLGVTASCARCHDHKYDPISQEDYYSLYGIFRHSVEPTFAESPRLPETTSTGSPSAAERVAFEAELQKRQEALQTKRKDLRKKILHELRSNSRDYLVYTVQRMPTHRTRDDVSIHSERTTIRDRAAYSTGAAVLWQRYLETRSTGDPVFGIWRQLVQLDRNDFARQAEQILVADSIANSLVRNALLERMPKNMVQVAEVYGDLLEETYTMWQTTLANDGMATVFSDSDRESLRRVLFGRDSPIDVPFDRVNQLYTLNEFMEDVGLAGKVESLFVEQRHVAPTRAMILHDMPVRFPTYLFVRGNPLRRGKLIDQKLPSFLRDLQRSPADVDRKMAATTISLSGRKELAESIVSPRNPRTARVIVNRLWQWHFGRPLVATPNDFGTRGTPPSHPALLDYLAAKLIDSGWSLKVLHREMVLSATYQQSSQPTNESIERDPNNRWLSHANRRRLEWETLRDSWLQSADALDRQIGGPSVEGVLHRRRSIYSLVNRKRPPSVFSTFDVATSEFSVGIRGETTIPQQTLFLLNHPLPLQAAQQVVQSAVQSTGHRTAPPRHKSTATILFRRVLARDPTVQELDWAISFLEQASRKSPAAVAPIRVNTWSYGYGRWTDTQDQIESFTQLPYVSDQAWQGGKKWPDAKLHYLRLTSSGGHTGIDTDHAAIRRWTAPADGTIRIEGKVTHGIDRDNCGDGVRATIVSSRSGVLATTHALNETRPIELDKHQVLAGEQIDFVTSMEKNHSCDLFEWIPVIEMSHANGRTSYRADADFSLSTKKSPIHMLTPDEQLAQALLICNEFQFID